MILHRVLPFTLLFACVEPGDPKVHDTGGTGEAETDDTETGEPETDDTETDDTETGEPADTVTLPVDDDGDGILAEEDCDDADASIGEGTPWYPDADGDGYGGDADALALCPGESLPAGTWLSTGGDCDDSTAAAAPGLEEICDDGLDNDCDGTSIGCRHDGSVDRDDAEALVLTDPDHSDDPGEGEEPPALFSPGEALAADIDGDGQADLVVGAPQTGDAGAFYVLNGPLTGTAYLSEASAFARGDTADGWFGWEMAAGDMDGDGYPEVIGAAPVAGQIFTFAGPVIGDLEATDAAAEWTGDPLDQVSMAFSADLTGDGEGDLLVGAPYTTDGADGEPGAVWVISGSPTSGALEDEDLVLWGQGTDRAGISVAAAGDVDGDGAADALIGAWTAASGEGYGAAYIVHGPLTGAMVLEDADQRWTNGYPGNTGQIVAGVGDLDGDGLPDVGLGLPSYSWNSAPLEKQGAVWVVSGLTPSTSTVEDSSFFTLYGPHTTPYAVGTSVDGGDFDGDGHGDLLYTTGGSSAQVRYGPLEGTVVGAPALGRDGAFTVDDGTHAAIFADMNGDGIDDLYLIGGSRWRGDNTTHVGWLFFGTSW